MATGVKAAALTSSVLAWLVPGGGHLYLGKRRRALVFFLVVTATFTLGILNQGRSYIIDPEQPLSYLATLANVATGPIELISRRLTYREISYRLPGGESDPQSSRLLDSMRRKVSQATDEYGTTYLLTAGLMNILLILDAFDIAIGRKV